MDGGAESGEHFHLLEHVFAASGPNDEKLAALIAERKHVKMHRMKLIRTLDRVSLNNTHLFNRTNVND